MYWMWKLLQLGVALLFLDRVVARTQLAPGKKKSLGVRMFVLNCNFYFIYSVDIGQLCNSLVSLTGSAARLET